MDLINNSPVATEVFLMDMTDSSTKYGFIISKATFKYSISGKVQLDAENPYPLFEKEEDTELGPLPRDLLPITTPDVEVCVLGAAHTSSDIPVRHMTVALTVGDYRRELLVMGDRIMKKDNYGIVNISNPEPFLRMPLDYSRAYGGTTDVLVAEDSYVQIVDTKNPEGKGFDPESQAKGVCQTLDASPEYPVFNPVRHLPNVEDPRFLIKNWEDSPEPASWAPLRLTQSIRSIRALKMPLDGEVPDDIDPLTVLDYQKMLRCAHSDWILPALNRNTRVEMQGLSPEGVISFYLPSTRIFADYVIGAKEGTRELKAQMLVLLPEERRFYLVYRHFFSYEKIPSEERCIRMRVQNGA